MTIQEEIGQVNNEFIKGNGKVALKNHDVVAMNIDGIIHQFRVPSDQGRGRLPGWFWAGIWDYMAMPDLQETLDVQMLEGGGWGFISNGTRYWTKQLSSELEPLLIYEKHTGKLTLKSSDSSVENLGVLVGKSLYHLQRRFEENGWFEPQESKIKTCDITDYLVK